MAEKRIFKAISPDSLNVVEYEISADIPRRNPIIFGAKKIFSAFASAFKFFVSSKYLIGAAVILLVVAGLIFVSIYYAPIVEKKIEADKNFASTAQEYEKKLSEEKEKRIEEIEKTRKVSEEKIEAMTLEIKEALQKQAAGEQGSQLSKEEYAGQVIEVCIKNILDAKAASRETAETWCEKNAPGLISDEKGGAR